jgi:hypothetical protein
MRVHLSHQNIDGRPPCKCSVRCICAHCVPPDNALEGGAGHQTAVNRFFRNPDLCTLVNKALLVIDRADPSRPGKACSSSRDTSSILAFRGVTCEAWDSVMLEQPTRSALSLTSRSETIEGVLVYLNGNASEGRQEDQPSPSISYDEADACALLAVETNDPLYRVDTGRGPRARIFTHHHAVVHRPRDPLLETSLWIQAEQYEICSTLPLACEMFLTQPPQTSIRFGIRYEYLPGLRAHFTISNENGVRFGDVVDHFATQPGLMKQSIRPGHELYRYRRWLRDPVYVRLERIAWEYKRAVVRGYRYVESCSGAPILW